jgi:hypothetical protein
MKPNNNQPINEIQHQDREKSELSLSVGTIPFLARKTKYVCVCVCVWEDQINKMFIFYKLVELNRHNSISHKEKTVLLVLCSMYKRHSFQPQKCVKALTKVRTFSYKAANRYVVPLKGNNTSTYR